MFIHSEITPSAPQATPCANVASSDSHSVICVGNQIFLILLGAASAFLASTLSRPMMLADFTGADVQFD